jgi:ferric-dicitrate binding protein FerR (iron transport regulator)
MAAFLLGPVDRSQPWHCGCKPLTDKTGAPVTVRKDADKFVVTVEGHDVGLTAFGGRGLVQRVDRRGTRADQDGGTAHRARVPDRDGLLQETPGDEDVVDRPTRQIMDRLQR